MDGIEDESHKNPGHQEARYIKKAPKLYGILLKLIIGSFNFVSEH